MRATGVPFRVRMQQVLAQEDAPKAREVLAAEFGSDVFDRYTTDFTTAIRKPQLHEQASTGSLGSAQSSLSVASVTNDDDEEEVLPGGVWLAKKGEGMSLFDKRRYFVLRFGVQSQRLKFVYFEGVANGVPTKKKGSIVLTPSSIVSTRAKLLLVVRHLTLFPSLPSH
jgi:hypothetical protein